MDSRVAGRNVLPAPRRSTAVMGSELCGSLALPARFLSHTAVPSIRLVTPRRDSVSPVSGSLERTVWVWVSGGHTRGMCLEAAWAILPWAMGTGAGGAALCAPYLACSPVGSVGVPRGGDRGAALCAPHLLCSLVRLHSAPRGGACPLGVRKGPVSLLLPADQFAHRF